MSKQTNLIQIKAVNGKKDGKFAVIWKWGRKHLGFTQQLKNGNWANFTRGCQFSESPTLSDATWVMKEYLVNKLDPFCDKEFIIDLIK